MFAPPHVPSHPRFGPRYDLVLLAQVFAHALSIFIQAWNAYAKFIDDIICDVPKALELFAVVLRYLKGASFDENRRSNIAVQSSENRVKRLGLLQTITFPSFTETGRLPQACRV